MSSRWIDRRRGESRRLTLGATVVCAVLAGLSVAEGGPTEDAPAAMSDPAAWVLGDAFAMPASDDAVTIEHVVAAKSAMRGYLLDRQGDDGSWRESSRYGRTFPGGVTSLVTFALLSSGQPYQTEPVAAAIEWLSKDAEASPNSTYVRSMRAHVWASLPDRFGGELTRDAGWLSTAGYGGLYDYGRRNDDLARYDHSVTQYGLLGLWEVSKRQRGTPALVWQRAAEHFIDVQNGDGGWGYLAGRESTPTMTAAGTTALMIAQRRLNAGQHRPHPQLEDAIKRGVRWLDLYERSGAKGASKWRYYYLLSLERVALASGHQRFGGRDWLAAGTREILADLRDKGDGSVGGGVVDTAFALAFLSRGAEPVWIGKVELPAGGWNHRPNDIARLTDALSQWRERGLGWQVVRVSDDPRTWLNAPLAYVSVSEAASIDDEAAEALRRYVELGGQLVVNPVGRRPEVMERVRSLGEGWFPAASWSAVGDGAVERLGYGGRSLVWLLNEDWGIVWQRSGRAEGHAAWRFIVDRFVESHGSGVVTHRFDNPWAFDRGGSSPDDGWLRLSSASEPGAPAVRVVRAASGGGAWPESAAWERVGAMREARGASGVATIDRALSEVMPGDGTLLHVAGAEALAWSDAELGAVRRFAEAGGLVLVETIGGRGDFAASWVDAWSTYDDRPARVWRGGYPGDALRTAGYGTRWWQGKASAEASDGSGEGGLIGEALRRSGWRQSTSIAGRSDARPVLQAVHMDGRPAVFVSHHDLTLGGMGVRSDEVTGLDAPSATRVLNAMLDTADAAHGESVSRATGRGKLMETPVSP
ncbi:MAG: DUF4159 domain-containing protein [Planctomycetota bacterium]